MKATDLLTLMKKWDFPLEAYKDVVMEIGDICAIRKSKGVAFRRNYERAFLLLAVALKYGSSRVLEFGTGRGFVTAALSMLENVHEIYTIDKLPASQTVGIMKQSSHAQMSKVSFISKKSSDVKRIDLGGLDGLFDLVFIDGEHSHKAVEHDFKLSLKQTTSDAIIVFDDYRNKHRGVKKYISSLKYDKILVSTDGWVYENKMIKVHGDADNLVDNKEMGSGQVILYKGGERGLDSNTFV